MLRSQPASLAQAVAQTSAGTAFAPGRLWDGKTPDFRGIWRATGTAYVNLEGHPGGNGLAASASVIVDPPDGKIPYKPEARAQRDENYRARATADPSLKCYQAGVPRATYLATPLQILQSPGNFAIVYEENHAFRVFHTEDRPHFDATDWWMGDTRYRWEGDTLVADVVALIDQLWLDQAGNYHSTEFHVIERYRLTGADTLEYEARSKIPWSTRDHGRSEPSCSASRSPGLASSRTNAWTTRTAFAIASRRTIPETS